MTDSAPLQYFIGCRTCAVAECLYPDLTGANPPGADLGSFLLAHNRHTIEVFRRLGSGMIADRSLWDPLVTTCVMVGNGSETLVLRSGRDAIEQPRVRRLLPGCLRPATTTIALDTDLLASALRERLFPHVVRPAIIEDLLEAADSYLRQVDPETLPVTWDSPDDPSLRFAMPTAPLLVAMVERCRRLFHDEDRRRACELIRQSETVGGAVMLRLTGSWVLELAQSGCYHAGA